MRCDAANKSSMGRSKLEGRRKGTDILEGKAYYFLFSFFFFFFFKNKNRSNGQGRRPPLWTPHSALSTALQPIPSERVSASNHVSYFFLFVSGFHFLSTFSLLFPYFCGRPHSFLSPPRVSIFGVLRVFLNRQILWIFSIFPLFYYGIWNHFYLSYHFLGFHFDSIISPFSIYLFIYLLINFYLGDNQFFI